MYIHVYKEGRGYCIRELRYQNQIGSSIMTFKELIDCLQSLDFDSASCEFLQADYTKDDLITRFINLSNIIED